GAESLGGGHSAHWARPDRASGRRDEGGGRVAPARQETGGEVRIAADHGNAETMLDPQTRQPHTAHTLNVVPLLYIGRKARMAEQGALQDVAPSLLAMMGLQPPPEMTGKPLIRLGSEPLTR